MKIGSDRRRCRACDVPLGNVPAYYRLCPSCYATAKRIEHDELVEEIAVLRARVHAMEAAPSATIDPTMLKRLLQLCHPDRHGGSEAATTATKFLLAQRNATRGHR